MRKLSEVKQDSLAALSGITKSVLSHIPVFEQIIAGLDAYERSSFERNVLQLIKYLSKNLEDLGKFFQDEYFRTEEGQLFTRKVIDAAIDVQLEDKQELFVNALINAPTTDHIAELQKLKFVDMLRGLSRAALMILADMHKMFADQVKGPGRNTDPIQAYPLVDASSIAVKLGNKYEPYLVTAAISEMESHGLFSRTGEWRKDNAGRPIPGGGFSTELCYTDFTASFVEFITVPKNKGAKG